MKLRSTVLMLALVGTASLADAQIRSNAGFRQKQVARNDDGSAPIEPLGWTLNFFGRLRTAVFVNNNGNITFDSALPTYTPFGLTGVSREIIAPFFADVDTRSEGSALVTYGNDEVDGHRAFGVNYVDVGYYNVHDDKRNSFQLVLIERPDTGQGNFDIEFNYSRIQWETGDASGGENGFGGVSASVGWSNGTGLPGTSYELPGSLVPGSFLDNGPYSLSRGRTPGSAATARTGRWAFRARGGTIIPALTIVTGCPVPNAPVGRAYTQRFDAYGSRTPYRWSIVADPDSTVPNLTMSAGGILSGTPATPGQYAFTVRVAATDEDGEVSVSRRCGITVDPQSITISTNTALPATTAGARYETRLRADGTTNPVFDLYQSAGVPGLTLNANGTLSGTPAVPGNYQFQVRARSEAADAAIPSVKRFRMSVNSNRLTLPNSCLLPNGTGGVPFNYQFRAEGGVAPYRWSVVGALPTGLSMTPEGRVQGIPTVPHWWPFTVSVQDSAGNREQSGCGVVILFPEVRVTSACPLPGATAGLSYSQRLAAAGGSGPYAWSVDGNLPAGLRLSPDGVLAGTPVAGGVAQFRLKVADGRGQAAAAPCSLAVNQGQYGITSCPLTNGYAGETYSSQMFASGGVEPYLWSAAAPLPAGLRLSPAGFLSGSLNAGTYNVSLRATDITGNATTRSCSLTVLPQALRLTNACPLPAGTIGKEYTYRLGAAGGVEPYAFSVRGDLPAGVRLAENGTFSGAPTQAGLSAVELAVRDRNGQRAATVCTIGVEIPDLPSIRVTGLPSIVAPASAGPRFTVDLGSAYPLAIDGEVNLVVEAATDNPLAEVNRADPAVRLSNGQRTQAFRLEAGQRSAAFQIPSTGTVASAVTVSVSKLRVAGVDFVNQATAQTRVNRLAPVLTNVCYAPTTDGFDLDISGYSTTRDLTSAELSFGSNNLTVDLAVASQEYFASDESVRTGGTFRVRAPYRLTQGNAQSLGQGSAVIRNSAGASPSRPIQRCN